MSKFSPLKFYVINTDNKIIRCSLSELADANLISQLLHTKKSYNNHTPSEKEVFPLVINNMLTKILLTHKYNLCT